MAPAERRRVRRIPTGALTGAGALLLATGCHSAPFTAALPVLQGPATSGSEVQLTYSPGQSYWPVLTADGRGVLYQFSQPGRRDDDRCVGLMPSTGGTRYWQLCDHRNNQDDSTNGFAGYALRGDGALLYVEATGPAHPAGAPNDMTLWLADSAQPFQRRALTSLPVAVGGARPNWLANTAWTGASTFVALAQMFIEQQHCQTCFASDSLFTGLFVIAGTITPSGVSLEAIPGTAGAIEYSLARQSGTIVFFQAESNAIQSVPIGGGAPTVVAVIPSGSELSGISCSGNICVVTRTDAQIWRIDLVTGELTQAATYSVGGNWFQGLLTANGHDVVVQAGGSPGILGMLGMPGADLYLVRGVIP